MKTEIKAKLNYFTESASDFGNDRAIPIEHFDELSRQLAEEAESYASDRERETAVNLLKHITKDDSPYAIMYGDQPCRFATKDRDFTPDQLFDEWKSITNK